MLTMPAGIGQSQVASIVGIDPGSSTLGIALIRFNIRTLEITSTQAFTVKAEKLSKDSWENDFFGDLLGRIYALKKKLLQVFKFSGPFLVACEAPFYSRAHPNAYGVLMMVIDAVREVLFEYDPWKSLFLVDPPSVKNAVGAKGNAKKEEVREKILAMQAVFKFIGPVPIDQLDEHSLDSIAVAYVRYKKLLEEANHEHRT